MKENFLPWFLLFCALGLSGTAAYYSVIGLSIIFSAVAIPVIIMGTFLEISKIAIATYLHDKWKVTYGVLKIYLTIALVTLSLITSLGIYGLLSTGFQGNISKLEINDKKIKNLEVKKDRFVEIKTELQKDKETLDKDISKLRDGLSTNTTTQSIDKKTGQVITRANNLNRKSFDDQLKLTTENKEKISIKIDNMNDSITKLDIEILNMESLELEGTELGSIKYISDITGWEIKKVANILILLLIFVFDPLAITLIISTNQAFKSNKKEDVDPEVKNNYEVPLKFDDVNYDVEVPENYIAIHDTIQVEPKIIEKIVEVPVEVIREVERIVEVPVEVIREVEKIIEVEKLIEIVREIPIEVIVEVEKIVEIEVPIIYYVMDNGDILDEKKKLVDKIILIDEEIATKKVLTYKK